MAKRRFAVVLSVFVMILGGVTALVAPFLGVLGTVVGMVQSMPTSDQAASPADVSAGISSATGSTITGAIGALVGLVVFAIGLIGLIWTWARNRSKAAPDR